MSRSFVHVFLGSEALTPPPNTHMYLLLCGIDFLPHLQILTEKYSQKQAIFTDNMYIFVKILCSGS